MQILKALDVLARLPRLTVGDEDDAVRALEHQSPRRLIIDLSRYRVELKLGREAGDGSEIEWQEVEEQGAVRLCSQRYHRSPAIRGNTSIDIVQVRRLPGSARAIVHDLAGYLTGGVVD